MEHGWYALFLFYPESPWMGFPLSWPISRPALSGDLFIMEHVPVLLEAVLKMAGELGASPRFMLDGTFGRGGHTQACLKLFPFLKVLAIDQDADAIEFGESHFAAEIKSGRLALMRSNFASLLDWKAAAEIFHGGSGFDLILLDLGVSSPQLDRGERGFSFYHDGPLDMRMDQRSELTAAHIINNWDADDLKELFRSLGELHRPGRVVEAIIAARRARLFQTTGELSALIEKCEGWRKKGCHPATQYFLALRLAVNREIEVVREVILPMIECLADQGRLLVITFHSLEDRIVKYSFKEHLDKGFLVNKKVIQADRVEAKDNPRARSAKLRVFQRGQREKKEKGVKTWIGDKRVN
ncbi:MAG: 16S rRNA (cytosine(1402)-N(4))-methyltransferase RsmH [Bdellovibrionales bacterium]|nr:16S rRNA (cytosine(1402)-N(4))-methyltransferase RsmH [Bdellovibrionales bacterium]